MVDGDKSLYSFPKAAQYGFRLYLTTRRCNQVITLLPPPSFETRDFGIGCVTYYKYKEKPVVALVYHMLAAVSGLLANPAVVWLLHSAVNPLNDIK